jgi:hypothetical protein
MTDAQRKQRLAELSAELDRVHTEYLERFAKLRKKQFELLKQVTARVEALKVGEMVKDINKKHKK